MSKLSHPKISDWSVSKQKVVNWILEGKCEFANHEIEYFSSRFPTTGEDMEEAVKWAKQFGHRDKMAEIVCKYGEPSDKTVFAYLMSSYEDKMKKSIESPKGAYKWVRQFPGDREEMRDLVQGGEWAVRWAEEIGDEELMKSRINHTFYERKFEREVEGDESVSFVSSS